MMTAYDAPRKDDRIVNCAPWPTSYRAETDACTALEPRLERQRILNIAPFIAGWFLDDSIEFARSYGDIVDQYHAHPTQNFAARYLELIGNTFARVLKGDARAGIVSYVANEHDFANMHRSVWLLMTHALARLLNFNLHGDWGDPPGGATSQGRYEDRGSRHSENFHTTPNAYGSYAIGSQDLPPPDLGIGEAIVKRVPIYRREEVGDAERAGTAHDVRDIARKLARALADRSTIDEFGQHPYHRVVKKYYFDQDDDYRAEYADVIGRLLYPSDPNGAAALAHWIDADKFAEIHRGAWLVLAHRLRYLVGDNPFGDYAPVDPAQKGHRVELPHAEGGRRFFDIPNAVGKFTLNLDDIDPDP
jgi:hypothetical protein